jgi:putative transcriptional regulator
VAETQVEGPIFGQSVVLLLAHGDQGTLGLIINRPTRLPLSEVLPDIAQADKESRKLFFGGPVGIDNLIFLFRSDDALAGASHVTDDVYFSGDRQILQKVIGSRGSDRLRIYIGHSGWAPGQLDMEIARGDWQIVRADAGTMFDRYPERIWQKLSHRPPPSIASFVVNQMEQKTGNWCFLHRLLVSRS